MNEDNIRTPDLSFRDQLINDYDAENNQYPTVFDPDLERVLEESRKDYQIQCEKQLEKEKKINHLKNLFKKLDIQLNYLKLSNDNHVDFLIECFEKEKNSFIECEKEYILLFKAHYDFLKNFIDEIYLKPLSKNKIPKIDQELYEILLTFMKYV